MTVLGARVSRHLAEELRLSLARQGLVEKGHSIIEDGSWVLIPLSGSPDSVALSRFGASLVDANFPQRSERRDPIGDIRASVSLPDDLNLLLPERWELFGEVLVVRLPKELSQHETDIAEAYARVLGAKTVLRDMGGVTGQYRTPVVRTLLGDDPVAVHRENGVTYKFDASKIMFSSGNMDERRRMAKTPCDDETVVDMFAGIGYFSLPIAVYQSPKKVVSCELNEVAYSYLVENIGLNGVPDVVEPILGDNRDLPGNAFADRVIMGYVKTTHEFLPTALRLLKNGGVLHYHETCPNDLLPDRPIRRLREVAGNNRVEVLRFKGIKSYAPGVSHVVVDARVVRT